VLLTGAVAYKIKKPVRLPFLDFTSLSQRRHFCEEELRINRRLAPELYVEVIPIGGTPEHPDLGTLPAIEYAVKMHEFPSQSRLDQYLKTHVGLDGEIEELGELIGRFHLGLPAAGSETRYGSSASVVATIVKNLDETVACLPDALAPDSVLYRGLVSLAERLAPVFDQRKRGGAIKEGHGDLHLENLVYFDGHILPFDALEFDPGLRWLDVIDEAAFLTMDLMAHERIDLACAFLNRYLEVTGDYDGLMVLDGYLAHRAVVRAKVRAIKTMRNHAASGSSSPRPYLALASKLLGPKRPAIVMTHGLSGSGKTTVSTALISALPAIRLRSDLERKRLAGLEERQRSCSKLGAGLYSERRTASTYAALEHHARAAIGAGFNIILDAAFLQADQRQRIARLAEALDVPFAILDCIASDRTLRDRIRARLAGQLDASEADLDVLDHQIGARDELDPAELARTIRVDTEQPFSGEKLAGRIRSRLASSDP
jgi:hypothetical protein